MPLFLHIVSSLIEKIKVTARPTFIFAKIRNNKKVKGKGKGAGL